MGEGGLGARAWALAALVLSVCGGTGAQGQARAAAASEPLPWPERLVLGGEFRGSIDAEDPTVALPGGAAMKAKCAVVPTESGVAYELALRTAADNPNRSVFLTGLGFELGTGTCTEFNKAMANWIDIGKTTPRLKFVSGGGDYVLRVSSGKRQGVERDSFLVAFNRLQSTQGVKRMPPGAEGGTLATGAPAALRSANAAEEARTAYLQMCGKGHEKLSAATCAGMKRDLDAAVAAQAAAAREAEVMGVYRQLCAPGARKLSAETCTAMLEEAKRTLSAPSPVAPPRAAPAASSAAELRSTYDELCAPGAQQVSAETCAALRADAAARPAPARPSAAKPAASKRKGH